jgi:hypothetical protein
MILTSYWAKIGIFVCRGIWWNICHLFDCSISDNNFAYRFCKKLWNIAPNDQRVITGIGLSDCSLLFSIGKFHTNSFLWNPVDFTEVIRFRTLQCFRYVMFWSLGGRLRWRRDTTTASDVGGATLRPPASAGVLYYRRPRRRRRWLAPAAAAVRVSGATHLASLPPTRTSRLVARLCNLRPLGSGLARADGCPEQFCCEQDRPILYCMVYTTV